MILTKVSLRELTAAERQALERLASSRTAQARLVERARILLAIADGRRPSQVARDLGLSRPTVYTGIHRFNDQGLPGLEDQPRVGRPPTYTFSAAILYFESRQIRAEFAYRRGIYSVSLAHRL
jgi:DNA-binding CsgD family transcriptional regulator